MTKNQAISEMIIALTKCGFSAREALDMVCGAGTYDKLAEEVYYELRRRAGMKD
jgi:hypothetical protein